MKHMYINKQQEHKTIIFITQLLLYIDRERNFQSGFPGHFPHFKIPYQKITICIYILAGEHPIHISKRQGKRACGLRTEGELWN